MHAVTVDTSAELDKYEALAGAVKNEVAGLSAEQLRAHPIPGTWSIQQITIHLADAESVFADRIKWILAEDNPPLPGFDENKWMSVLAPESRPADEAATLIDLTRRHLAIILRQSPPEALKRTGKHSQYGAVSITDILAKSNWHLEHHLKFLRQKRGMV